MANPYEATNANTSHPPRRRVLWPSMIACTLLLFVGFGIALPGLQLLNQELGLIPTRTEIFDVEINGQPVSNATATRYFVGVGCIPWGIAIVLSFKLILNWRHNRTVPSNDI